MADEYGTDEGAEHEPTTESVGAIGGIHGVAVEDIDAASHAMEPDGTAVPDVDVPPEHHHSGADGFVQEKLHGAYDAVTHPDTEAHQPSSVTEEEDRQRHAETDE